MAELTLTVDDEIKTQFLEQANIAGLNPSQFLKSLLYKFIGKDNAEEWEPHEPNEETKQALLQGEADFKAGKLKSYTDWREMIKDIEARQND